MAAGWAFNQRITPQVEIVQLVDFEGKRFDDLLIKGGDKDRMKAVVFNLLPFLSGHGMNAPESSLFFHQQQVRAAFDHNTMQGDTDDTIEFFRNLSDQFEHPSLQRVVQSLQNDQHLQPKQLRTPHSTCLLIHITHGNDEESLQRCVGVAFYRKVGQQFDVIAAAASHTDSFDLSVHQRRKKSGTSLVVLGFALVAHCCHEYIYLNSPWSLMEFWTYGWSETVRHRRNLGISLFLPSLMEFWTHGWSEAVRRRQVVLSPFKGDIGPPLGFSLFLEDIGLLLLMLGCAVLVRAVYGKREKIHSVDMVDMYFANEFGRIGHTVSNLRL